MIDEVASLAPSRRGIRIFPLGARCLLIGVRAFFHGCGDNQ